MVKAAILHEGNDRDTADKKLLKSLLIHLDLDADAIHFEGFRTKSNFFNSDEPKYGKLKMFVETGQIEKILFIVDADDEKNDAVYGGFNKTQTALMTIINRLGFDAISQAHIVCDPLTQTGYLESFILSTIPDDQRDCIETFLSCSQFKSKENHKAILYQIYETAYPNAPYNFAHPHFEPLKALLTWLFS